MITKPPKTPRKNKVYPKWKENSKSFVPFTKSKMIVIDEHFKNEKTVTCCACLELFKGKTIYCQECLNERVDNVRSGLEELLKIVDFRCVIYEVFKFGITKGNLDVPKLDKMCTEASEFLIFNERQIIQRDLQNFKYDMNGSCNGSCKTKETSFDKFERVKRGKRDKRDKRDKIKKSKMSKIKSCTLN